MCHYSNFFFHFSPPKQHLVISGAVARVNIFFFNVILKYLLDVKYLMMFHFSSNSFKFKNFNSLNVLSKHWQGIQSSLISATTAEKYEQYNHKKFKSM